MTEHEFAYQMNRLTSQFKNAYGEERAKLVWREVKDFDARWFASVIDRFIGECSHPPLLPEFREEAAKHRERIREIERNREAMAAKQFFAGSSLQGEDVKTVIGAIKKRIVGEMNDQDWSCVQQMCNEIALASRSAKQPRCRRCYDEGTVIEKDDQGYECVWRCYCAKGRADGRKFPMIGQTSSFRTPEVA